jgi:ribosome-binding protein aMBF1 (putative translation factor)
MVEHSANSKKEDYSPWIYNPQLVIVLFFEQLIQNMSELTVSFGLKVREQRKLKKLSQEKLALLCNIDRSYMGRIERGEVNVTIEKLYELAKALDIPVTNLLP